MNGEQLTLLLGGKEYQLNDSLKEAIEERARQAFKENWQFSCHWEQNDRGDPLLCIQTTGEWVPIDRLEQLEFEMQEVEQPQDDGSDDDETEELDSGSGMKSVPRDEVDMKPDAPDEGDDESPDTGFMVTHPSKNYVPQPEQDDPETVPPHPDSLPEDPTYVQWIPANDTITEHWETGRAIIPLDQNVEWNLQLRADESPQGAMKESWPDDDDGEVEMVPKTNRHDEWEGMMDHHECEVIAEKQPSDSPPSDSSDDGGSGYQGREADETLDGKYGGQNWNV